MFRKGKRLMAFLLTLVVVVSLVYDGGYASWLAQAASPDTQVETASEEGAGTSEGTEGSSEDDGYVAPSEDNNDQEESGSEETQEPSDKGEQGTDDPTADGNTPADDDLTTNDGPIGEEPSEDGNSTPSGTPTETPAGTPEPTVPAEPTTAPEATETPAPTEAPQIVQKELEVCPEAGTSIRLTGQMPENAIAVAKPVADQVQIEGQEVLAAYDITIYSDESGEEEYQPEKGAIQVEITNAEVEKAKEEGKELNVYHMQDENSPAEWMGEPIARTDSVEFMAASFSIWTITTPEGHPTKEFVFMDSEKTGESQKLSSEILSNDETLPQPETPVIEDTKHKKFLGWYIGTESGLPDNAEKFEKFGLTAAQIVGRNLEASDRANPMYLWAKYETIHYVYFMSSSKEDAKVIWTKTYTEIGETITTDDVPFKESTTTASLLGWSTKQNPEEPDASLTIPEDGRDLVLYPVEKEGSWIHFDSVGGTIIDSVFVSPGGKATQPENPTKPGYQFAGWYYNDGLFDFNQEMGAGQDISLTAQWTVGTANYTVIVWKQMASDVVDQKPKKNYEYVFSQKLDGTTGQEVTLPDEYTDLVNSQKEVYEGFELNQKDTEYAKTLAADGSTTLNVYYDRRVLTYQFDYKYYGASNKEGMKWTGLYGSSFALYTDYQWDGGFNWYVDDVGYYPILTSFKILPAKGNTLIFRAVRYDENTKGIQKYWIENEKGEYILKETTSFDTSMDCWVADKYMGFHADAYLIQKTGDTDPNPNDISSWTRVQHNETDENAKHKKLVPSDFHGNNKVLNIRNSRMIYDVIFMYGNSEIKRKPVKYGYDLKEVDYTPEKAEYPDGIEDYYEFYDWYKDPGLTKPFEFEKETMPAGNVTVYGKWAPKNITVTYKTGEGATPYDTQTILAGSTAPDPGIPERLGYTFAGWLSGGKEFHFSDVLTTNTVLEAQWVSKGELLLIYQNGSGENAANEQDPKRYNDQAKAELINVPEGWESPNGADEVFLGWEDAEGNLYYAGQEYTMDVKNADKDTKKVTLYAKWAVPREVTLTYVFNNGTDKEVSVSEITPNGIYTIDYDESSPEWADFSKEGYYFAGWKPADPDYAGGLLHKSQQIQIDTSNPSENRLIAQWERCVKVRVRKVVEDNMATEGKKFSFSYGSATNNAVQGTFELGNGETFIIPNLKKGDTLTVTENSPTPNEYRTFVKVGSAEPEETNVGMATNLQYDTDKGENIEYDLEIVFTNKREVVPTGLTDNMAPFAAMILAGLGAGVVFFLPRRRRQ